MSPITNLLRQIRRTLDRHPRLKKIIKKSYYFLRQETPITYSKISKDLLRACVGKDDPIILDIGCNDGSHTLWFFSIFKNPKVYCFEPDPRAIKRFKEKVGNHTNVQLFEMVLSAHCGETVFHQSGGCHKQRADWDLSGSIRKPKDHLHVYPWVTFGQTIMIKTDTLDAWCNEHGIEHIDFIWMDVQGAEVDVFRGGQETLKRTRVIYTEYSNRELYEGQLSLKDLMKKHLTRFKIIICYPGDVLLINKHFKSPP